MSRIIGGRIKIEPQAIAAMARKWRGRSRRRSQCSAPTWTTPRSPRVRAGARHGGLRHHRDHGVGRAGELTLAASQAGAACSAR
jgi:hypothetical protein